MTLTSMREMSIALLAACLVVATASTSRAAAPPRQGWMQRHRPAPGLAELGLHTGAFALEEVRHAPRS